MQGREILVCFQTANKVQCKNECGGFIRSPEGRDKGKNESKK
jgi:hypothetical protein